MGEKNIPETADERLINQLSHRVSLLISTDKELSHTYVVQDKELEAEKSTLGEEIKTLKEEITQLHENMHQLRKTIFLLGHTLKNKAPQRVVEAIQEKIDAWPLEDYITKQELEKTFQHYTKQQ